MKRLFVLFLILFASNAYATDLAHENVAIIDGTLKVGAANPLHVTASGIGFNTGVVSKTFTSSNITQVGVLGFTAAGSLLCNEITLETNSTGLAAGTNFTITSNSPNGLAVICAATVANLNGNKSLKCSAGGVTNMVPFTLTNANTLTLKCTVADCTGNGTITITPNCQNLTSGAGLS